ncbi:MAG: type II secretion system F family protein [Vallitaleaceae bacterium]|jgi:type IV pilus assembly protein PilC|nr:type II secretion system F family protein [Vallitaleaceae bacterium]
MANFNYTVITKDGKNKKGKIEASDKNAAINVLKESGYFPLSVVEVNSLSKDIVFGNPIKVKDLTVFCQQFEAILTAGISVLEALNLLKEQSNNKFFSKIIANIYNSVETGESLAGSMRPYEKYFTPILINMIEAGEASGNLEIALARMAVHFEKEYRTEQSVKKAVMYPIIVSILAVGVVVILLVFVIPVFVGMFQDMGMELPFITRMLIGASEFVQTKWYILIAMIVLIVGGFKFYGQSEIGKMTLSGISLKAPIIGNLSRKVVASRFSRTLSTLLASGLPLLDAIEIVSKVVDNYTVQKGLMNARDQVSKGMPLSKPIEEMGVFPPMITHMVRIGENTGQLEPILNKVADFYDSEVETAVSQLTTMLEPLIIVVLALVVGTVVIAIIQPMFQMYQGLGQL